MQLETSETLSVLQDLIGQLPPRAAIALSLTAEAIKNPLFLQLLQRPWRVTDYKQEDLEVWVWAGLVSVGSEKIGKTKDYRLVCWIEPGSLGDTCVGILRHNKVSSFDFNKCQFPGILMGQVSSVIRGQHPASSARIDTGIKCGACRLYRGGYCAYSHNPRMGMAQALSLPGAAIPMINPNYQPSNKTHVAWDGCQKAEKP